jgi:hypothetical protein
MDKKQQKEQVEKLRQLAQKKPELAKEIAQKEKGLNKPFTK